LFSFDQITWLLFLFNVKCAFLLQILVEKSDKQLLREKAQANTHYFIGKGIAQMVE